jgi:RNA polymerase sigma-70 factor, ECF subfamily
METAELINRCREGDDQAIEAFVECFSPQMYRLACAVLEDPGEASEAAQDALVAAVLALKNYRGGAALSTWVYAIGLNECRARLRRRWVRERLRQILTLLLRAEEHYPGGPEDEILRSEEEKRVWAAVQSLNDLHRIPLILRYYQDLPVRQIAEMLGVQEGTVHSRLNTARARLHSLLSETHAPKRDPNVQGGLNG